MHSTFPPLCGKLYFPISFTHYLILIFFSCPLVLPSFCQQHQVFFVYLFNAINYLVHY
ncbi:hypothetical protein E2C01_012595 [Portunus trituberculatus]|uniref:Uncharacterized protein n=1 Tax=Portunus trituberculatus TaxID=210409 RepID=A0A5B7DEM4_PORTR|nr:hypothetical protein [Portunus trituberculatus]